MSIFIMDIDNLNKYAELDAKEFSNVKSMLTIKRWAVSSIGNVFALVSTNRNRRIPKVWINASMEVIENFSRILRIDVFNTISHSDEKFVLSLLERSQQKIR